MPIGVIAGRKEYLDAFDGGTWQYGDSSIPEAGVTFFAGTFVRHPLAMAAAQAVLKHLIERGPALQDELGARTAKFVDRGQRVLLVTPRASTCASTAAGRSGTSATARASSTTA
jgi:glutamate-1-semialdehyde aminotransferase